MKKILTLILIPIISFGQRFEVGVRTGGALFSKMHVNDALYLLPIKKVLYSDLTIAMQLKNNFDIGLKIGGNEVSVKNFYRQHSLIFAEQMTGISVYANKKKTVSFGNIYIGLCAGMATFKNLDSSHFSMLYPDAIEAAAKGTGPLLGLNAGLNCRLSRHLSLNLEASVSHYTVNAQNAYHDGHPYSFSYMMYPVTLGLKYNFAIGKKYKLPDIPKTEHKEQALKPAKPAKLPKLPKSPKAAKPKEQPKSRYDYDE